jgi:hypothetical protein
MTERSEGEIKVGGGGGVTSIDSNLIKPGSMGEILSDGDTSTVWPWADRIKSRLKSPIFNKITTRTTNTERGKVYDTMIIR